MAKFYFFKTVSEKGRNRLRALAGQFFPDGTPVEQHLNISADRDIRAQYPLGTTYGTDKLEINAGYYDAGQIYPLGLRADQYLVKEHTPFEELQRAYATYLGLTDMDEKEEASEPDRKGDKVSFLTRLKGNKDLELPSIKKDGFYVDTNNWYLLLRNIQNQVNTLMIGPSGSGKTELVMLACKKLGIPCRVYDMGSMYDPVSGLLGVHRLQEGGTSTFDYAKFTQDISSPGVVLLDELSRAPVTTNNILFPCLDSRRQLPVEIAGGNDLRAISVHEDCCFIATANVGSEYTGTMSMDRALVNRFFPVELDYMPVDAEQDVLIKRCRVTKKEATIIVSIANMVRGLYKKQELSCTVSTRETLMAAELVADGWDILTSLELVFLPLYEGTRSDGERGIVCKLLMTK